MVHFVIFILYHARMSYHLPACYMREVSRLRLSMYSCKVCDFKSHKKSYVYGHMRLHFELTLIKCNLCEAYFSSSKGLAYHTSSHLNLRQHACDFPGCTYRANSEMYLKRHKKTHK